MAKAEVDHLIGDVAIFRHDPRQHAAIAIFALNSILKAGRTHELLKLLGRSISKCALLTAMSAVASLRRVITNDPVFDAFTPKRVTIDDASRPLSRGADGPLVLRGGD